MNYEGKITPGPARIAIVVARFNELVTDRLLEGALAAWRRHGGDEKNVDVARVPGAFELPLTAQQMAGSDRYDAVVCLGCVIRGATSHYDYVCAQAASGVLHAGLNSGVPVIFGVLTTDSMEQALDRAGGKAGNKGYEAMVSAMEMADLLRQICEPVRE